MADIPLPPDIGRIRHLTAQMHKSEDDDGNPIPEGFIFAADGASGHTWLDPVTVGAGGTLVYNVQDYGAVGDGTTDDTTAIEDTFDAADATGGGIIYFPPTAAYYKITSRIDRTGTSKYQLLGGGTRHGPRVHQATANTGAFKFAPSSGTANRLLSAEVRNLTISGAGGASSGNGIEFANDGHMNECFVYGFFNGIVVGTESYYSTLRNVTVTDCDNIGIWLNGTNNCTVYNPRITGLFSTGSAPIGTLANGILVTGGFNVRIIDGSVEYFTQYGVVVEGTSSFKMSNVYFETQQSATGFAHLWLGKTTAAHNPLIDTCHFQGDGISGFNAIKLDNAIKFAIVNSDFGTNVAIDIVHTGGSSGGVFWLNTNDPAGTFNLPSDTVTSPGGAALTIKDEGSSLATAAASIDFVGSGVVASGTTGAKTVTISGAPTGAAGGDLSGTYPNPTVVDDSHSHTAATLPTGTGYHYEVLMAAGSSPPEPLETGDGLDWLYVLVPD